MTRSKSALSAAAAALMLSPAFADALAQEFEGATALEIDDAIAKVSLRFADTDAVTVDIAGGDERPLTVSREGGTVRIAGEDDLGEDEFWRAYQGKSGVRIGKVQIWGGNRYIEVRNGRDARFEEMLENYPAVTVTLPEGSDLSVLGSAVLLDATGPMDELTVDDNIYERATFGDARTADITLSGSGAITLGDVTEAIEAVLSGSGDVRFGNAANAVMSLKGSGDLTGGDIAGDLSATLSGSGDVTAGRVGGMADLSLRGSGDVEIEEARSGAKAMLSGSGDVEVGRVEGPVEAELRGSGDIDIREGRATAFEASLSGSGDVSFGGLAVNPVLRTRGSGDIDVADFEGEVDARGDGIRVAGKSYGEDD